MKKKVKTLMLTITNECNLNCVYCYERHICNTVMSLEIAQEHITKYLTSLDYQFVNIDLFGGEIFIYFERVKEICEWTWSQTWKTPFIFNITTNGTILTPKIKKWLKENRARVYVSLSLDGTRNSHNKNRSDSYDNIDLDFFSKGLKNCFVKMTISELSLSNLTNNVIHIHKLGFQFSECNLAVGVDWNDKKNLSTLKKELHKLCNFYINNPNIKPAQIIDMEVGNCEKNKNYQKWCGIGKELEVVDIDGKIYPCNFITPMTFSTKDIKLLSNINYEDTKCLIDNECFQNCYIYAICPTCYGANYLLTKAINKKDKTICNLMKVRAFYSSILKAHKIIDIDLNEADEGGKIKIYKTIKAIEKISSLYSNIS